MEGQDRGRRQAVPDQDEEDIQTEWLGEEEWGDEEDDEELAEKKSLRLLTMGTAPSVIRVTN